MKKVLSLVLVIAMVLSSMSFAFAGTFEDVTGDYEEAVDTLAALGVVTGYEDGTYRPDRIVTRAEMAKLIVEILGYGDLVAGSKSNFADTQGHWADAWIALAAGRGLVIGTGDGKFTPDRQVSYDEAITMVIRALGYTDASNELKGMTWPTNFKVKAAELDLLDGIKSVAGGADRGGVAQLLFNALDAALVTIDTDGNVVFYKDAKNENKPLLSRIADLDETTYQPVSEEHLDPDHKAYAGDVVDLTQYMYQNITVYEKDGVVVYVKDNDSLTLEGTVTANTLNDITVEDADEDEYTFDVATNAAIYLNGEEVAYESDDVFVDLEDAEVTLVLDAESDDKLDESEQEVVGIIAKLVTDTVQVEEEYVEDEVEIEVDGEALLPVNDDDEVDFDKLVVTGDAESLEDLEVNDVLALYYGKGVADEDNKLEIVVTRNTVEGKITRINSDKDVTIDGEVYEPVDGSTDSLNVGDEVVLYLDQNGDVYSYEYLDGPAEDYAVVVDVYAGYETANGTRLAEPKVKLLTAEGEKVTYVVDDSLSVVAYDKDATVAQDITVDLELGAVVKFSLDDDVIDEIIEPTDVDYEDDLKTTGNSFNLANNAVIFNLPDGVYGAEEVKTTDAKVVDEEALGDTVDAFIVYDGAEIEALVVYGSVGEEETVYGLLTADDAYALDEDDDKVVEYTAFVDGVEVTYLGESDSKVATASAIFVELTIEGGKLTGTVELDDADDDIAIISAKADDVRVTTYVTLVEGSPVFLADDVVVYVVDEDGDISVGSKSDIRDNVFTAYNVNADDTNDFGVVVVFEVGAPGAPVLE